MKKFKVKIVETLEREVFVNANSKKEAMNIVQSLYENEDIILDSNDFKEVEFF
ncbi:DpnD/PcfM family protein [Clostridium perfringens]|uniref:DpnD/PcfM family protein n=1 Tax=Clostridium perfringens TaxID=1502 RepID=UPI000D70989E|nr:DpnD/PcfM family protein [Clostridium perfringens]EHK2347313.1 DpnD/PcfM family protein [Clostridium perfringens]MBO3322859.1 DpnD/PcfM family protein [Clostridium perfringens]MBO3331732.1 DpnD/PcfM family protein [Clostridium perfringens]MCX0355994.1 DpnD/PcfM family protein [Clostridium perfringens]PWW99012.1 protein DpnD [Clostridium perfringens]